MNFVDVDALLTRDGASNHVAQCLVGAHDANSQVQRGSTGLIIDAPRKEVLAMFGEM